MNRCDSIWRSAVAVVFLVSFASAAVRPHSDPDLDAGLALYDQGEFVRALPMFESAALRGVADAQFMAGLLHHRGRGTEVSGRDAVKWYAKAAEQNHPAALANLGVVYRDGLGNGAAAVAPDADKAREYLRRAAYLENTPGQLAYAAMLINQRRTRDELLEGIAFMRIAADAGDEIAQQNLEDLEISDQDSSDADTQRKAIERTIAQVRALAAGAPPAPGADSTTGSRAAAPLRMRPVSIQDPMINNCTALQMLVPADWTFSGRIEWLLNDSVLANPAWTVADPASGAEMRSLPFRQFTWTEGGFLQEGANHLGMTVLRPIRDPAQFVARFWGDSALAHLARLTPTSIKVLPPLAEQSVREWGAQAECRAFRLRYAYDRAGKPWQEDVTFALLYSGNNPTTWLVTHGHSVSAPAGVLDQLAPVTAAIYASGEYTSQWRAGWRVCYDLFLKRAAQEIIEARKLAAAVEAHRGQMQEIAREMERDRESSMAARHRAISEALGGIETYADPLAGRRVELPQGYREAWVNQHGEYLLSPSPGFDPNASNTRIPGDWKPMKKVDPMGGRR